MLPRTQSYRFAEYADVIRDFTEDFVVGEKIGFGAFGVVYRCQPKASNLNPNVLAVLSSHDLLSVAAATRTTTAASPSGAVRGSDHDQIKIDGDEHHDDHAKRIRAETDALSDEKEDAADRCGGRHLGVREDDELSEPEPAPPTTSATSTSKGVVPSSTTSKLKKKNDVLAQRYRRAPPPAFCVKIVLNSGKRRPSMLFLAKEQQLQTFNSLLELRNMSRFVVAYYGFYLA
eukprot:g5865.t1